MDKKIKKISALSRILAGLRKRKKKIVFTNGCFDILHIGHIRYLKKAKALGDILVVGLNSDKSVKMIKGRARPLNKQGDRAEVLASLSYVDYVTVFSQRTPGLLIRALRPDVLVKGGDWKIEKIVGGDFVKSYGGSVATIPFVKGYSTTSLIERIAR